MILGVLSSLLKYIIQLTQLNLVNVVRERGLVTEVVILTVAKSHQGSFRPTLVNLGVLSSLLKYIICMKQQHLLKVVRVRCFVTVVVILTVA